MASIPIPSSEKDQLLTILKDKECSAAKDVYANLVNYDDLVKFFVKYGKAFDGDNAYLDSIAAIFDDAEMVAVGIYYNKTSVTLTNPKVVVKCTDCIININTGGIFRDLEIVDASQITVINITNNTKIDSMAVAGASEVEMINIQPGSCILTLLIKSENGLNSKIDKIDGDCVQDFSLSPDSEFGGFVCDVSGGAACLDEVIGLSANTPTSDGFTVAWTNPINSTGNQVLYRKVGDTVWLVPNALGNATGAFGPGPTFTFHAMDPATAYEVKVANSCLSPTAYSAGTIVTETTL